VTQYFSVHPTHPQQRLIGRTAEIVREGGLAVFPTDATYALGCHLGDKQALDRMRALRRLDRQHLFTLMCRDLSEISVYARVTDPSYRIIKHLTPGPFTFVLPATREVPRRLVHPKRKTIGLRVPDDVVAQALLESLGEPMMTTTLRLPDDEFPLAEPDLFRDRLDQLVDVILDAGACGLELTTVVDLTGPQPEVLRQGVGEFH
jgi:tRNA threonylcarbamoyl adenosine modification protein (Sua5/YciO/YrdC/YwlC family)